MDISYKSQKEAFVSNLTGGTIWEINAVTMVAPISVLLWSVLQTRHFLFTPYTVPACLIDFLLNTVAILLATTLYSSRSFELNVALLLTTIAALMPSVFEPSKIKVKRYRESGNGTPKNTKHIYEDPFPIKSFVTAYRGSMMVITCVCILAVDFNVFPRRFAKVENWGTSLMDLGVGSFVFSAGTVSARSILKQHLSHSSKSLFARLYNAARHSLPLLILGLVRLYSVKNLDYAEHVTEYGVHWNFFFTLALLPPFVAFFDAAFSLIFPSYSVLAFLLAVIYESILASTDLKAYILTAPRVDLLSKNREGVFSFFGYLAIFLSGQGTGMYILPRSPSGNVRFQKTVLEKLATWSVVWILLFYVLTSHWVGLSLLVSRRLANLAYVLWVNAFNCCQLTLFCLIETLVFPNIYNARDAELEKKQSKRAVSPLLRAFNRNGLAIFLLANLLTGLVNLTMPTLRMDNAQAVTVLLVYMAILSAVALTLDRKDISIKL